MLFHSLKIRVSNLWRKKVKKRGRMSEMVGKIQLRKTESQKQPAEITAYLEQSHLHPSFTSF